MWTPDEGSDDRAQQRGPHIVRQRWRPKRVGLTILLPAALIRLALAPFTSWPNDTYPWVLVGWNLVAGYGPYGQLGFSYPPGWAAVLALVLQPLALVLSPDRWAALPRSGLTDLPVVHPVVLFAAKLPSIVADLAVGWLLFRRSWWASVLWLFNPLVVFVSSVQGQYDSFVALTVLASLLATVGGAGFLGGLACGLGTALKFVPIYLGPVLIAVTMRESLRCSRWAQAVTRAARWTAGFLLGVLPTLPLLSSGFWIVVGARLSSAEAVVGGLNFAALRRTPWASDWLIWTTWYPTVARYLVILIPLAFAAMVLWRGRPALMAAVVGSLTAMVAFQLVTQPQYIVWLIPAALLSGSRTYALAATALAVPALTYYSGLVGHLPSYVSQPLSFYLNSGYSLDSTLTHYLNYLRQPGVFGGQSVSDSIGLIGSLVSSVWLFLLLISFWKALTDTHEER